MKKIIYSLIVFCIGALFMTSCDDVKIPEVPVIDPPELASSTPANGATSVAKGDITIVLTYNQNVFCPTVGHAKITLGSATITSVSAELSKVTIKATGLLEGETYQLVVPADVIQGPTYVGALEHSISFTVKAPEPVVATLCSANPTTEAVKLYNYLVANYRSRVISGAMANVNWNTDEADRVFTLTGKYPAMNTFDYIHIYTSSPGGWIDYDDISPVTNWHNAGGIVSAMWHWNVPTSGGLETSTTLWEGSLAMAWNAEQLTTADDIAKFADAKVGDRVLVTVTDLQPNPQGSFKGSDWGQIANGYEYFNIDGDFELPVTQEILDKLQSGGLIISGQNYTMTGVYLLSGGTSNEYTFSIDKTNFNAANATVEGTWENDVFTADLAKVATSLKQLQNENIALIWRPFHEAAGGWFWWGKDAESFKKLWIAMFNYFQTEGVNNLIWVWTTETNDDDWYPGDEYVDIIGRDLYNKDTNTDYEEYIAIDTTYPNRIISLSECGTVGLMSEQWEDGARWSWFMPWYGNNDAGEPHGTDAWWTDAMNQDFVITRGDINF